MVHPPFLLMPLMKDLRPAVSFPPPTPLYFTATNRMFITLFLIFPSTVPAAFIPSNTPFPNTLHCISFLSIPSSHLCFTFQPQSVWFASNEHTGTILTPTRRATSSEPAVDDNLPWGCPFPQPNTPFLLAPIRAEQKTVLHDNIFSGIFFKNNVKISTIFNFGFAGKYAFGFKVNFGGNRAATVVLNWSSWGQDLQAFVECPWTRNLIATSCAIQYVLCQSWSVWKAKNRVIEVAQW